MSARDIQKLRRKFIVISMLSIFIVLLFIGTAINVFSYSVSKASIRKSLERLTDQEVMRDRSIGFTPSISDIFAPVFTQNAYYIITYDGDDVFVSTNTDENTNAEEKSALIEYSENVLNKNSDFGRHGYYYYLRQTEDDLTTIAYLDCSTEVSAIFRLLLLTIGVSAVALLVTFLLVWKFSGRAVQPEIENNRRQKEFITNASHELKTPLAVIRANTELIEMTAGESEWTKSTLNQVDRMDGLIRNLVLISKSQEQEKGTVTEKIDVSTAVEQTTDTYAAVAQQNEKTLIKKIEKDVKLVAEEGKIRQLTTILVDNALKYCDEKGTIEVTLRTEKKGISLIVSNSYAEGKNVNYEKFFDRFYRQDQSHNIDRGGYGIGLSIADNLCKQCGGSIKADWHDGTIFFICRLYDLR